MKYTNNIHMKLGGILHNSLCNGDGMRCVIFFSGCSHNCKGCHNEHLKSGEFYEPKTVDELCVKISNQIGIIDGVTLSGGEPFDQNIELLDKLVGRITSMGLNVWIYTGYTVEQLVYKFKANNKIEYLKNIFKNTTTIVDGEFIEELLDETDEPRGSTNQRILGNEHLMSTLI